MSKTPPVTYLSALGGRIRRTDVDGAAVLVPVGEFDLACVDTLRSAFTTTLTAHPFVVLDLSEMTFADSTTLGVLVAANKQAHLQGGWVRLADPQPNVRKLLALTAIDTVLGLFESVQDAVAAHDSDPADLNATG